MRWPHPVIALLLVTSLLLDACAWVATNGRPWPSPGGIFLLTMAASQTSLVAVWAVLGPGKWWSRISVLAAVAAALAWFIQATNPPPEPRFAALFGLTFQGFLMAAGLSLVRFSGQHLRSPYQSEPNPKQTKARPWQFSVADLLQLTTAWAILLAVANRIPGPDDPLQFILPVIFATTIVPPALAATIAVLYDLRVEARLALVIAVWIASF